MRATLGDKRKSVLLALVLSTGLQGAAFAEPPKRGRGAFDYQKAAARIQEIAEAFYPNYESGLCPYYGRVWKDEFAKKNKFENTGMTVWKHYKEALTARGIEPERLDCTLYAKEILKAGLARKDYRRLWNEHYKIWKDNGFSGWSVGHLLTEKFGWRAFAVIDPKAPDYPYYMSFFKNKKEYPVWRQPNIKIEGYFIAGRDDEAVEALLARHEFGWGFSEGGIHTWITQRTDLKECHFDSGPTRRYDADKPYRLLETTRFIHFKDYNVHLVVFPPE